MVWEAPPPTPATVGELAERALGLAGWSLGELAARFGQSAPADLRRHKGWPGQLVEMALGARANSRPVPDFPRLGVELKTVPVDERGRVRESTFVTGVRLRDLRGGWEESRVREKLSCVLFVPVVGEGPPAERYLGGPLLWRPTPEQERVLAADWSELALLTVEGALDQLVGQRGEALQLRPKAARAERTEWVLDRDQRWVTEQPRGFYLRARFVEAILGGGLRR